MLTDDISLIKDSTFTECNNIG